MPSANSKPQNLNPRVYDLTQRFRVYPKVQNLWFSVQGLVFMAQYLGFKVDCFANDVNNVKKNLEATASFYLFIFYNF